MENFDFEMVKNPEIFKDNVLPAHGDFVAYATEDELFEKVSSLRLSLNGLWKFHYAKAYRNTVKGFEKEDYDCNFWDDIRVPAHMQMEGYDVPAYINVQYPWDGHEKIELGQVPEEFNPVGSYVKYFRLPDSWDGKEVHIVFEGVESGFALWLNGEYVGYSEDTFTPSEFDLTPYLKKGINKLAAQVIKWTSSSWMEDQDFFRFSGIYRDVYLQLIPEVHLNDVKVRTVLNDDFSEAELELTIDAKGEGCTTEYVLYRNNHQVVKGTVSNGKDVVATEKVFSPMLWSAEDPQLYQLVLRVKDSQGEITEVVRQNVGFRKFEMKDGLMLINGKRIVFKGVNRHEFSCETGRVVTYEETLKDIITMKKNNINAIRTSHYQNSAKLYELCDIYGLYMIAENNMETHGSWSHLGNEAAIPYAIPGSRENCMAVMLDRINSTYQLDKNHPSVLIWSIGNESHGGKVPYEMSQLFRKLDPDRLVHYEGICHDRTYNDTSDMESQMYPSVSSIEKFLKEHTDKPFICCEYTHAMANSCGGMFKYTDLADREPRYQGGFIWDYVDQSIRKKNRFGEEFQAYGGDHGERPCDYNFSGNGIVDGQRNPYAKMQDVKFNYQSIKVTVEADNVKIRNTALFTNTNEYDCIVVLERDGKKILEKRMATDVEPLSEKEYELPEAIREKMAVVGAESYNENGPFPLEEYAVTVSFRLREDTSWAERGHEVAFGQGVFKTSASTYVSCGELKVIKGDYNLGVKGNHFSVLFNRDMGNIVSYRYGGRELIESVPKANFWRAPVDNDKGNRMAARYAQWKLASLYASPSPIMEESNDYKNGDWEERSKYPIVKEDKCSVSVTFKHYLPTVPASAVLITYNVTGDGRVWIKEEFEPVKGLTPMPEFGMLFKFSADFNKVEYYGNGPEENYVDRNKGAKLGIYSRSVEDMMEKYLRPQETGNRTGVRWAKIMDNKGRGLLFEAPDTMNFSALPYTPEELEAAEHPYELPRYCKTVVRCSSMQMGIAGDDSWGAKTHSEFLLPNDKKLTFVMSFKGI
ncbi:glycoside hydrolase family 2 TIM barrel-domain containing protein [Butyrivibrio sp. YAB3001]|uniref:glycoside hydrolase family 2 TIM barrel-domain containing protein n=1 Tax=Butyrivibrio sp. YAB3001 TaxID=1520812 RepID=UPI0008F675F7|nr:glycoside hydrolase family 2 TIM barrel-domain containing protein [Butyrivibrio sp. YAB3001]SFC95001.1 beta-galactosidase [Butyrivibrio sp. YAB3001]